VVFRGRGDQPTQVWDLTTDKLVRSFPSRPRLYFPALSADGKYLLFTEGTNTGDIVKVWDLATDKLHRSWEVDLGASSTSLSPDAKLVLTARDYGARIPMQVWDVESAKVIGTVALTGGRSWCGTFSSDNKLLLTQNIIDQDAEFILWDLAAGKEVHNFKE